MKFTAEIDVMPLKALLILKAKAVGHGLSNMGLKEIGNVRIGKHITLEVEAGTKKKLKTKWMRLVKTSFKSNHGILPLCAQCQLKSDRHPDICTYSTPKLLM